MRPLLHEDRRALSDAVGDHTRSSGVSPLNHARHTVLRLLTSKFGHYLVLLLVSLDVSSLFVNFVIGLFTCEGRIPESNGERALNALEILSLVFSCLFMAELLASIWAFGFRYLKSWFHLFDAAVIIASFVIDVLFRGVVEEVATVIIVARLWRVFKIIEELSVGAEEQTKNLEKRAQQLEKENVRLKQELHALRLESTLAHP